MKVIAAIEAGLPPGEVIRKINKHQERDIILFKDIMPSVDLLQGEAPEILGQKRLFYAALQEAGSVLEVAYES